MPNIKSAKKRVLVIAKKNEQNRMLISEMKTAIRAYNNAIDTNNIEEAERLLPQTFATIDRMVSKGVIHKNNAANKKSALAKKLSDVKSGKKEIVVKKDNKTLAAERAKAAKEAREALKAENAARKAEREAQKAAEAKLAAESEKAAKKTRKATKKAEKTEEPAEKPKRTRKAKTEKAE